MKEYKRGIQKQLMFHGGILFIYLLFFYYSSSIISSFSIFELILFLDVHVFFLFFFNAKLDIFLN